MELNEIQRASQEQFSKQSSRYAQGHILENVDDVRSALANIPLPGRARALDVATGAGHTALLLASPGHDVIAADLAAPMLERVREGAAARNLHVETRQHAAEEFPYDAAGFDLVTCRVAAHHFSGPMDFIRETARVLKNGGHFLLIDGSVADDESKAEEWLHALEKLRDPSHQRLGTPRFWSKLCEQNGLRVRSWLRSNNRTSSGISKRPQRRTPTALRCGS
ncbi:MAG: hypothetical protein QOD99_1587 [Chthoniobacter sp.]|jgi:ubiquinone/menaquinone biosynthesis C-methylase UbiE|nr:hypothetical protein [Chthoniobacter sp.]